MLPRNVAMVAASGAGALILLLLIGHGGLSSRQHGRVSDSSLRATLVVADLLHRDAPSWRNGSESRGSFTSSRTSSAALLSRLLPLVSPASAPASPRLKVPSRWRILSGFTTGVIGRIAMLKRVDGDRR